MEGKNLHKAGQRTGATRPFTMDTTYTWPPGSRMFLKTTISSSNCLFPCQLALHQKFVLTLENEYRYKEGVSVILYTNYFMYVVCFIVFEPNKSVSRSVMPNSL